MVVVAEAPRARGMLVYRHSLAVRLTHWINVLCLSFLLLSGLQIFNAHPELYWGHYGANEDRSFIAIGAVEDGDTIKGVTRIGSLDDPDNRASWAPRRSTARSTRARLSGLDHHSELPGPRHRPALALLLRLALRHQRAGLSASTASSAGISAAIWRRAPTS